MITTCSIETCEREQEFRHVHGACVQGKIGKELETNVYSLRYNIIHVGIESYKYIRTCILYM